jgi:molybdopterin converting factor small subunit
MEDGTSIIITIEGAGFLRKKIGKQHLSIPRKSILSHATNLVALDSKTKVVFFVNRIKASDDYELQDGDSVVIVPLFFGG